jgi:hypothetical protein
MINAEPDISNSVGSDIKEEEIVRTIKSKPMPADRRGHFARLIDQGLRGLSATDILRTAFVVQLDRVEEMRKLEREQGVLVPRGYREVKALVSIAVSIAKIDVKVAPFRRKKLRELDEADKG